MGWMLDPAFVNGMLAMGFAVAGFFFLRFWTRTRDSLFIAFALAFWLLALNAALVIQLGQPREELTFVYLLRLAAFLLIIVAILRKNVGARKD